MRHFISNVISGFIWKKTLRDKVRTMIRYPKTREYIRYVRNFAKNMERCEIKTMVGYGASNFIIVLNNKHVFKFPLLNNGKKIAEREKRIVDAFYGISPIKIPLMKIIPYENIYIRKYEFAKGKLLTAVNPMLVASNRKKIAKQIAEFLYVLAQNDPKEIADLKPNPKEKPDFLYGWNHGDIWQNFMMDDDFNITFFIDWELANFGSLEPSLRAASHHWDKFGYRGLIVSVIAEYAKLYFKHNGK